MRFAEEYHWEIFFDFFFVILMHKLRHNGQTSKYVTGTRTMKHERMYECVCLRINQVIVLPYTI